MVRSSVRRTAVIALVSLSGCVAGVAGAAVFDRTVPPGTPAQVAAAVLASTRITKLDATSEAQLALGGKDSPITTMPGTYACDGSTKGCVFGATASTKVVVLFGDSHAMMWLPAVSAAAAKAKDKLVLFWKNSCPAANLTNFSLDGGSIGTPAQCTTFRAGAIASIKALKPKTVIIAERTTLVYSEPSHVLFTNAQWQTALVSTIQKLKSKTTKVALFEDVPWFTNDPRPCLATYPTSVQTCAQAYPNHVHPGLQVGEANAARATGSAFIKTHQWLCTAKRCSPLVHDIITYLDRGHVDATYSKYLSLVVGTALATYLK
jgi:hypothetical protein